MEIIEEAIDELNGRSSKRWVLVLVALVVGAYLAVVLVRRARGAEVPARETSVDGDAPLGLD
jgi:hypothetical protein